MQNEESLKSLLITAPEDQLDPVLVDLVKTWGDEPTSLQILELLDKAAYSAGASEFVMHVLQEFLRLALIEENTTYEAVVAQAYWRHAVQ